MKCKKCNNEAYGHIDYCLECLEKKRKAIQEKYDKQKAKAKDKYEERKANHLCVDCATPIEVGIRCRECADKRNAILRRYRATHSRAKYTEEERKAIWSANGLIRATINNAKRGRREI